MHGAAALSWATNAGAPALRWVVHPTNAACVREPGAGVVIPAGRAARATVDCEARTLGWVDAPCTTLQMWAHWVRAEIPRVQSLPPAATGQRAARLDGEATGGAEAPEKCPQKV